MSKSHLIFIEWIYLAMHTFTHLYIFFGIFIFVNWCMNNDIDIFNLTFK